MQDEFIEALNRVEASHWHSNHLRGSDRAVSWLPICRASSDSPWVGVDTHGNWVAQFNDGDVQFVDQMQGIPLLQFLERSRADVLENVGNQMQSYGIPKEYSIVFPLMVAATCALSVYRQQYWVELALDYLERNLTLKDAPAAREAMLDLVANTRQPSSVRRRIDDLLERCAK